MIRILPALLFILLHIKCANIFIVLRTLLYQFPELSFMSFPIFLLSALHQQFHKRIVDSSLKFQKIRI